MASNERVHPACVNASNPYHECGVACLEKIAPGQGRKDKKKSDYGTGIKGDLGKKIDGYRRVNPSCPKTSNPYHECNENCPNGIVKASRRVDEKKSGSVPKSNRKIKSGSDSLQQSPGGRKQSSQVEVPDGLKSPRNGSSVTSFANGTLAKPEQSRKIAPSPKGIVSPVSEIVEEVTVAPKVKSLESNFSGISQATEDSDLEDSVSAVSDSYVVVGKYHVRPNLASTLHSILEKYGDVAANCRLESASLRAYHLECLCSVVMELHSTPFKQLTKAKVKEMKAVLKDVESVGIDVSWLRTILNDRYQATEAEKAECDREMESAKKQIEQLMEDLARKENEVAETKARIEDTRTRLKELELESSQLTDAISSAKSKLERLHSKPLAELIL